MKVIGYTLVVLVMGLLGYALYPNIRPTFEQAGWIRPYVPVEISELADKGEPAPVPAPVPTPEPAPATLPTELAGLTPEQMPERPRPERRGGSSPPGWAGLR